MAIHARRSCLRLLCLTAIATTTVVIACTGGSSEGGGDGGVTSSSSSSSSGGGSSGTTSSGGSSSGSSGSSGRVRTGACGGSLTLNGAEGILASFELTTPGSSSFCTGSPTGCDNTWLTIKKADGTGLVIVNTCGADCDACESFGCTDNCPQPQPVTAAGARTTWDGRIFETSTCQPKTGGAGLNCQLLNCAPAGKYIARMCAFRDSAQSDASAETRCHPPGTPAQVCIEVPFDWPTGNTIKGSVGP